MPAIVLCLCFASAAFFAVSYPIAAWTCLGLGTVGAVMMAMMTPGEERE